MMETNVDWARTEQIMASQQHDLLKHIVDAGFPLNTTSLIHLFIGGSQLHGAKVTGYDDLDIYGCHIEPPERILGVLPLEHFVWSSASATEKNTADDVDVTTYSLHRWGELIRKGNPAVVHYLFAANALAGSDTWERFIGGHREQLLSKRAARQYMGFAASQTMRLTGERGRGRHGQRPDLIEHFGFDVKFRMHYVRLLGECRELLREHKVTLPRPEKELLIAIRSGKYTQDQVFEIGDDLTRECEELLEKSDLPDAVNLSLLSRQIADAYQYHWRQITDGYSINH
jgi:predicted nucleotidyltransferase